MTYLVVLASSGIGSSKTPLSSWRASTGDAILDRLEAAFARAADRTLS
jgi:hypothetical protein